MMMNNVIFLLDDNTLQVLHEKCPASNITDNEGLMSEEEPCLHPVIYESIDEDQVKSSMLKRESRLKILLARYCWMQKSFGLKQFLLSKH